MEPNEAVDKFFEAMDGLYAVEQFLWRRYLIAEEADSSKATKEFADYEIFSATRHQMLKCLDCVLVTHRRRTGLPDEVKLKD